MHILQYKMSIHCTITLYIQCVTNIIYDNTTCDRIIHITEYVYWIMWCTNNTYKYYVIGCI